MNLLSSIYRAVMRDRTAPAIIPGASSQQIEQLQENAGATRQRTTERGTRSTPEQSLANQARALMWVDPAVRAAILDIRHMDKSDGRVKQIHRKTARAASKGGIVISTSSDNKRLIKRWGQFAKRLSLNNPQKLQSDLRGLMMEGNLPLQWVIGEDRKVHGAIRMPAETILPQVDESGQFIDPARAYAQFDLSTGQEIATFSLYQLSLVRLDPDNHDDLGCMGRPYLDASRKTWKQLTMTDEDIVIRRRERAPMRTSHILESATEDELTDYQRKIEDQQKSLSTNYYSNKKGGVTSIQGDANLDQIADVVYLLDTFFAGAPAPKGIFGYTDGLSRDILEDLKRDFYDELDALQDTTAYAYEQGFRMELLLAGINPDNFEFEVKFRERRTETPNQAVDRALKLSALNASQQTVWEAANLDPAKELRQRKAEQKSKDPYPGDEHTGHNPPPGQPRPKVSITPNNAPKGESATTIANK